MWRLLCAKINAANPAQFAPAGEWRNLFGRFRVNQDTPILKACKDCGQALEATPENFYFRRGRPAPYCKPCHNKRNIQWRKDNAERVLEISRNWRAANIEKERARWRRQYQEDPEKRRAAVRKSYRKHREKRCAEQRERSSNQRAKRAEYARRYSASRDPIIRKEAAALTRAKRKGAFIEPVSYEAIYERDGKCCYMCKKSLERHEAVFDHVKPLSAGGIHSALNIKLACYECNRSKGTKLDMRWIRYMKKAV